MYANFYEKVLFVKGDVATAPGLRQLLCPSRYASIRTFGELTLSLVARCIGWDPSWFGLLRRCCDLPSGLPLEGRPSSHGAVTSLDPKRVRVRAVAIRRFRVVATLPVVFTSSVFVCSIASLPKLPPPGLGADWRCRAARRPPRSPTGGARAHRASSPRPPPL